MPCASWRGALRDAALCPRQLVGLKSFRVAMVMLVGLLVYDVFWCAACCRPEPALRCAGCRAVNSVIAACHLPMCLIPRAARQNRATARFLTVQGLRPQAHSQGACTQGVWQPFSCGQQCDADGCDLRPFHRAHQVGSYLRAVCCAPGVWLACGYSSAASPVQTRVSQRLQDHVGAFSFPQACNAACWCMYRLLFPRPFGSVGEASDFPFSLLGALP